MEQRCRSGDQQGPLGAHIAGELANCKHKAESTLGESLWTSKPASGRTPPYSHISWGDQTQSNQHITSKLEALPLRHSRCFGAIILEKVSGFWDVSVTLIPPRLIPYSSFKAETNSYKRKRKAKSTENHIWDTCTLQG